MKKIPSLNKYQIKTPCTKRAFFFSSGNLWVRGMPSKKSSMLWGFLLQGQKGSMALEGSLVLPIFLFFMMTVLLSLEAVRFQSDVQAALHQAGNEKAFAGWQVKYGGGAGSNAESQIKEYLGGQLYPYLCVAGGETGLELRDLSSPDGSGHVEIIARYRLKPFISWLPIGEIVFEDHFVGHAWTGYTGGEGQKDDSQETYVYVTKTGAKYHLFHDCTYLRVQIQAVGYEEAVQLRNRSGAKYHACQRCKPVKGSVVYITSDGRSYHGEADCSSLKRTVNMIPLSEAGAYGPCSKCAG